MERLYAAVAAPTRRNMALLLIALAVLSIVVRLGYFVVVVGTDYPLEGDEQAYHSVAESFVEGNGWQDYAGRKSFLPPVFPAVLVAAYAVAGPHEGVARAVSLLIASLVAPLVFLLVRELLPGRAAVAMLSAAAWAVYPPAVYYANKALTENLAALLAVASVLSFVVAGKTGRGWAAAATGAVWAAAALNRPAFLFFPLFVVAAQAAMSRLKGVQWRWSARQWALGLTAFIAVIAPWTVRNYVEHGVFMPVHSAGGIVLWICNGDLTHPLVQAGMFYVGDPDDVAYLSLLPEAEADAVSQGWAIDEIKRNWRLLPAPVLNRAKNFWTPRPDPYDPSLTFNDIVMWVFFGPVLVLFVGSALLHRWRLSWPLTATIAFAFMMTLPFWGSPRFRFPVDTLIIVFAAACLADVATRIRTLWAKR
ncbi:MAG: hypothetical protein FJ319_12045 [SAR202 cluster bacterium]|nr:hypothetical protein [SAR202 cluster bacterium]